MAHVSHIVTVQRPASEVFDALADFATAASWDPGVRSSRPVGTPRVGRGARFDLDVVVAGPVGVGLTYRTTRYDRPRHVTHETRTPLVVGVDQISVVEADGTTSVTWDAEFRLRGPGALLDPLLQTGFTGVAERAVRGLEAWLHGGGVGHAA